jgi:hypothetical protein
MTGYDVLQSLQIDPSVSIGILFLYMLALWGVFHVLAFLCVTFMYTGLTASLVPKILNLEKRITKTSQKRKRSFVSVFPFELSFRRMQ